MNKKAIVSCGALYGEVNELLSSRGDWDIRFLPQGLHDEPDSSVMRRRIQKEIDELEEEADYDRIVLGYGLCGGGVEGLASTRTRLAVPEVHDCIPLLAGDENLKGNVAEPGTYYLSRGWMDCSCDAYREYLFFTDGLTPWRERFRAYKDSLESSLVTEGVGWWFDKDRLDPDKRAREGFDAETSRRITLQCVGDYRRLALIENDLLEPIHEDYAGEMYDFLDGLLENAGRGGLEFERIRTSLAPLKELLFNPESSPTTRIQSPEEPLELEGDV